MTRGQRAIVAVLLLVFIVAGLWAIGRFARSIRENAVEPTASAFQPGPPPTPAMVQDDPGPTSGTGVAGVFVEPDDGRSPILDELNAAEQSIDLAVYLITDPEIIGALEGAVARGVVVRVILEEHPFGGSGEQPEVFDRLDRAGVQVRWSSPVFRFSHIKTFVVDDQTAIIMNLNLTRSAFNRNREFGVVTARPADVSQAAAIFEADWNESGDPGPGPLIVSPTNSRHSLIGLIDRANQTIDIYAEVVRDREVIDALVVAEHRGVDVRLIMSGSADGDDDNAAERALLADAGVDVRLARRFYIHAKMVLVDNQLGFVGSQNFTATSLDLNRELGIILDDRVNLLRLATVFAEDFAAGVPQGVQEWPTTYHGTGMPSTFSERWRRSAMMS